MGTVMDQAQAFDFLLTATWWSEIALTLLNVIMIWVMARVALLLIRRTLDTADKRVAPLASHEPRKKRVHTVTNLMRSVVRYVVWAVAIVMVLSELDINIGPLLAGAGILGLAVGFGAQTFVRDVMSGLFLLLDDTINVGDTITFDEHTAKVESISIRLIKARKFDGELMMIPAGELRTFGNRSREYFRAVVVIGASFDTPPSQVKDVLKQAALDTIAEMEAVVVDDRPRVSILRFADSAVEYEVMVKTLPGQHRSVRRDLYERVLAAFTEAGLQIPTLRRSIQIIQPGTSNPAGPQVPALPVTT